MTYGSSTFLILCVRSGPLPLLRRGSNIRSNGFQPCPLTVPLLCSARGSRFKVERANQIDSGPAQVLVVQRRPQVDHVAVLAASPVEARPDVLLEVHAERAAAAVALVDRTGAAPLRSAAAHPLRQPQMRQHPFQRQLPLDVGEVDVRPLAD